MDNGNRMGIRKRAILFIIRKKSKSGILFVIFLALITLVLTGISIRNAAGTAETRLRQTMGGYFKIQTNWDSRRPAFVTNKFVKEIMKDERLKAYNKMNILYLMAEDIDPIPGRFADENNAKAQLLRILSNTNSGLHEYFYTRMFTLVKGRHVLPGDAGKALVSGKLAEMNDLQLGDVITLTLSEDYIPNDSKAIGSQYGLEIVGIYETSAAQIPDEYTAECDIPDNFIFIDENTVRKMDIDIAGKPREVYQNGAVFFLGDPKNMKEVIDQADIDEEGFSIYQNNKVFNDSSEALSKLRNYADTLVIIILIIGILLLSLIMTMWMRDRLHEIGILLAIGIKKVSLWSQFILETLLIMLMALVISWPVTDAIGDTLGNYLLNAISFEEQTEPVDTPEFSSEPVALTREGMAEIDTLKVEEGISELVSIVICALISVLISVSISSAAMFKMKPKDIFSTAE